MNLRDNDGHFQSREDLYVVSGSKRYRIDSLHEVDGVPRVVGLEPLSKAMLAFRYALQ
jgi:hypothetical protein